MICTSAAGRMGTWTEAATAAAVLLGPESAFITAFDPLMDEAGIAALRTNSIRKGGLKALTNPMSVKENLWEIGHPGRQRPSTAPAHR